MIARAAILTALLAGPALAVPILTNAVQWQPGTSPCAGACSLDWALERMTADGTIPQPVAARILAGEAKRVEGIARPGDIFPGMSFAVGGEARWDERIYQLADGDRAHITDELHVEYGGYLYRVAKIRTCDNWAPRPAKPVAAPRIKRSEPVIPPPIIKADPLPGMRTLIGLASWAGDGTVTVRSADPHPQPSPIPLPGGIWSLLTGALGLLGLWRLRGQE